MVLIYVLYHVMAHLVLRMWNCFSNEYIEATFQIGFLWSNNQFSVFLMLGIYKATVKYKIYNNDS